jgi:hypothetical protein
MTPAAPCPRIHQKSKTLHTHAGGENKKTGPGILRRKDQMRTSSTESPKRSDPRFAQISCAFCAALHR